MSISRFTQASGSYNPTAFKEFLDANKAGTFLADATITAHEPQSTRPYLSIALGDSSFTIYTDSGSSSTNFIAFQLSNGASGGAARYTSTASEVRYIRIHSAILCDNGLIIRVELIYPLDPSPAYTSYVYIALTLDSDGNLSLIRNAGANDFDMRKNTYSFSAFSYESNIDCTCEAKPQFGANRTSFANLTVISSDNSLYLPSAYIASSTQLSSIGLQAVSGNGAAYITNGIVYIKDN